jgi:hypothetical protein
MSRNELKRWRCQECKAITLEPALLSAPNPFDPDDTIVGCPNCKSVAEFDELCDEPGCERPASCGFPTAAGGYRRTCYDHSDFKKERALQENRDG